MTVSNQAERVIGVDVSMSRLDIADSQGKIHKTISNTAAAIKKAIVQKLDDGDSVFVVCEATGGYEKDLVKTLQDAGIPVAIANPRQVRQFASAMGRLEKSDPIDAEVICQFGQTAELPAAPVKTAEQEARDAIVRRREQVLEMIGQENNRLQQESDPKMKKTIEQVLKTLKNLQKKLDAEISRFLAEEAKTNASVCCPNCRNWDNSTAVRLQSSLESHRSSMSQASREVVARCRADAARYGVCCTWQVLLAYAATPC